MVVGIHSELSNIPKMVVKTIHFFQDNNLWYILSKNAESRSCKDAANKRYRLGHIGIPIQDELKSFFGKFINASGKEQFLVIHCRGNQELDFKKIQNLINIKGEIVRLSDKEMIEYFGLEYGTVNPFTLDPHFFGLSVLQIFDESVFINKFPPYTMMTNAGDLQWGIEFNPSELVDVINHKIVSDIVKDSSFVKKAKSHKIGVLTGNAPESGIKLWEDINNAIRNKLSKEFSGDISFPPIIMNSIPELGLSMELDKREQQTWKYVNEGIISLCQQGCTIITIACNTTQFFKDEITKICKQYGTKFINMEDEVNKYLIKQGINSFDFIGINYTTDIKKWSGFKNIIKKFKVNFPSDEQLKEISSIAYGVKQKGITGRGINKLRDLINTSTENDNVIIALTEISILMSSQRKKSRSGKNYIDTLEILADAISDRFMKERFPINGN